MRETFTWTMPLARIFGVSIRVHIIFLLLILGVIAQGWYHGWGGAAGPAVAADGAVLMGLLFLAVLLHELGHCLAARVVNGDADEVVLWPLGGLAGLDIPARPRAHLVAALGGPAINLALAAASALLICWLTGLEAHPAWNPLHIPLREQGNPAARLAALVAWDGREIPVLEWGWLAVLARFFWINWALFLANVVIPGFPLDGGRIFQSSVWYFYGFRHATHVAIVAGFICALALAVVAIAVNNVLVLLLAGFMLVTCQHQMVLLETGGDESAFGYDFSQGYTSLEGPAPRRRRRPSAWQRWLRRREARRLHRELEQRESEERRTDELLEKVQREGLTSLTDEERRFLKRVSDRYRNRHQ